MVYPKQPPTSFYTRSYQYDAGRKMTRVLAVSGSLRKGEGATTRILAPFLEGMKGEGASVELVYVKDCKIEPCRGEFHCWYTKPGECIIKDGMQELYRKLRASDIFVITTPVYIPLPGEMQNFINRLCPLIEPMLSFREGRTRARIHDDYNIRKIALVASGDWWEKENCGTVLRICEELAKDMSVEFSGALLRPHASLMEEQEEKAGEIAMAARKAGAQLVRQGRIPPGLLEAVSQPLVAEEALRERYNRSYLRGKERQNKP
jgi:multimeric flavodoxin WrbA